MVENTNVTLTTEVKPLLGPARPDVLTHVLSEITGASRITEQEKHDLTTRLEAATRMIESAGISGLTLSDDEINRLVGAIYESLGVNAQCHIEPNASEDDIRPSVDDQFENRSLYRAGNNAIFLSVRVKKDGGFQLMWRRQQVYNVPVAQ